MQDRIKPMFELLASNGYMKNNNNYFFNFDVLPNHENKKRNLIKLDKI